MSNNTYVQAGVDIQAVQQATNLIKETVQATYTPQVLAGLGAFGGLYDAASFKTMTAPVLVASTDGVGTKTKVAARMGRWATIGQDLVNHCLNDILVQGASPLFFLDYVASAKLQPQQIATIVQGIASACRAAECALLGGETAEMPGVYELGEVDLVGTIVGVVEKSQVIDGSTIQSGDVILGLPSTGLHTNGYSLARQVLDSFDWETSHPLLNESIGQALLTVHRSYIQPVQNLRAANIQLRGLAHITGGGIIDNLPRILPPHLGAIIRPNTWPQLPIFTLIQKEGQISLEEMFHAFNMGLGMLVIVSPQDVARAKTVLPEDVYVVGEIITGPGIQIINE